MIAKCCFLLVCLSILISTISCLPKSSKNTELNNITKDFSEILLPNTTNDFGDVFKQRNSASGKAEDKYLNTGQLIQKYGYAVQKHKVTTQDGYILSMFRIPGYGAPIFLMHGLLGSSDDFVVSGPDKALAYLLANASYDVWLGNARGNKYSKKHTRLSTEGKEYWDFTWNEIGLYDVPAMIDHALEVSEQPHLFYLGHGQGTTVFFVMCSCRPEYNEKIRLFISFGTIAWVWHIKSPAIRALIPFRQQEYELSQLLGLYELLPSSPFTLFLTSVVCSISRFTLLACSTVFFNIFGFDYSQIDNDNSPVQLSHFPAGSSFKQLAHYLQLGASQRFASFDYGEQMNLLKYNKSTPPDYPLQNIVAPMVIFYADNDWLSSTDDLYIAIDRLRNVQAVHRVPHSKFNHFDYIWGKDTLQLVYFKVMNIINNQT